MDKGQRDVRALNTYFEVARKEYDDTHSYYDGIDNKASIFVAISVAVPSILLSLVGIPSGVYGGVALVLYGVGFFMLIWALYHIYQSLRIRTVSFGAPLDEFQDACRQYDDEAMREAMADTWLRAAKNNHAKANEKSEELRRVHIPFSLELLFFFAAAVVALAYKL